MKKSKFLAAALAATMFATAACGLVACDKDAGTLPSGSNPKPSESQTTEYTVTFSGLTGANATKTTVGGKLTGTMPTATAPEGKEFKGWALTQDANSAAIRTDNYKTYPFAGTTTTITLYPVFANKQQSENPPIENPPASEEYTITFSAGAHGTLSGTAEVTTVNGKVSTFPTVTPASGWKFDKWTYTLGTATSSTTFTANTTVTAQYTEDRTEDPDDTDYSTDGLYINGECYELVINSGATDKIEYWFGGIKHAFEKGAKMSIYLNGERVSAYVELSSVGVDKSVSEDPISEFTTTIAGDFEMYLKKNEEGSWTAQFLGPTQVDISSDIPEGCAKAELAFANGTVTLYFVDVDGNAVSDLSKVAVYTYNDEAFGNWETSATSGKLSALKNAYVNIPSGWVFRWGSFSGDDNQSGDVVGAFKAGKTYVVELKSKSSKLDCKITEINV
ncbi:MAG: hypothetical protein K2O04_07680 [Clostridiales bacterium]|nr:hypothetical protein [Clostridiales bacterium]